MSFSEKKIKDYYKYYITLHDVVNEHVRISSTAQFLQVEATEDESSAICEFDRTGALFFIRELVTALNAMGGERYELAKGRSGNLAAGS